MTLTELSGNLMKNALTGVILVAEGVTSPMVELVVFKVELVQFVHEIFVDVRKQSRA